MQEFSIGIQGFLVGAGLIVAIGAQNAFVLTQAVKRNHAMAVAAVCAALDALLIAAGVLGIGTLVASNTILQTAASLGGAAFLIWFGAKSLCEAFKEHSLEAGEDAQRGLGPTLTATLAVSLLNPHVYLDTVIMLGAISGNFPGSGRYWFGLGAATASFLWFFGLSLAGRAMAPLFQKALAWRVLHLCVCLMVWRVAATLLHAWFTS